MSAASELVVCSSQNVLDDGVLVDIAASTLVAIATGTDGLNFPASSTNNAGDFAAPTTTAFCNSSNTNLDSQGSDDNEVEVSSQALVSCVELGTPELVPRLSPSPSPKQNHQLKTSGRIVKGSNRRRRVQGRTRSDSTAPIKGLGRNLRCRVRSPLETTLSESNYENMEVDTSSAEFLELRGSFWPLVFKSITGIGTDWGLCTDEVDASFNNGKGKAAITQIAGILARQSMEKGFRAGTSG